MTPPVDRVEAALLRLGAEHQPPPGWEARVLAAVATPRRRPWWQFAAPGLVFAGAAVFVVWLLGAPRPAAVAFDVQFERSELVRGDDRAVGDVAHVRVSGGGYRSVRIYRDEVHVVMRCPEDPACRVSHDSLAVDVPLREVGTYLIVALTAASPLPALPGRYDDDLAAAMQAGVDIRKRKVTVH
ncbi:MAG: hypothetical protein E6J90_31085 [Deltaproteobacteria bacterium]|nr:MAG: hypothetical protein E6J91_33800 [Deltaproteobacteria bacterium]TMQ12555.1 MAG: hypothetical protein E6J90_31085 [Deltaproteobacteria bacterium]